MHARVSAKPHASHTHARTHTYGRAARAGCSRSASTLACCRGCWPSRKARSRPWTSNSLSGTRRGRRSSQHLCASLQPMLALFPVDHCPYRSVLLCSGSRALRAVFIQPASSQSRKR
eukprot:6187150-Pleurochrysis_carterae.AAC.2